MCKGDHGNNLSLREGYAGQSVKRCWLLVKIGQYSNQGSVCKFLRNFTAETEMISGRDSDPTPNRNKFLGTRTF